MTEGFAKRALGDLPGDGVGRAPRFARLRRHVRAQAAAHLDGPLVHERPVGMLHGIGVDLEVDSQRTARR